MAQQEDAELVPSPTFDAEKNRELENCRLEVGRALKMMEKGRRLDAQEILESSIEKLEALGVTMDYLQAISFLADLMDDMDYSETAAEKRYECIELAASKFGEKSHLRATLMVKQVATLFRLLDRNEDKNKIRKYSEETSRMSVETLKVLNTVEDYPKKEEIIKDLQEKITFCELIIENFRTLSAMIKMPRKGAKK